MKLCNCLKKENCPVRRTCHTETVLYYARISCGDETYKPNCIKKSAKLPLKNVTQMIKNHIMRKRAGTILNYLLNTES